MSIFGWFGTCCGIKKNAVLLETFQGQKSGKHSVARCQIKKHWCVRSGSGLKPESHTCVSTALGLEFAGELYHPMETMF